LTLKILLCFAGLEIGRRGLEYLFSSWIIEYGVGAIAAFFLALLLARSVRKPVETALNIANRMAAGDLSQHTQITRRDEFSALFRALNQLNVNLKAVVGDVRKEVHGINDASREIALGNSDLSSRTESQASNLEQTAASMEQLTSTVKQSADTAQQARQFSTQTTEVARKGGEAVAQVVETMEEIRESSKKIADIIQVIDSIAFQTNILALNAAVEAARAGEQGRGFAVVASEVRSLAQRTSTAAREIKELITDSVSKVESGAGHVSNAGTTMQEIQHSVQRVSDLISEISSATGEQYAGINQVNDAVSQLDTMTQQNAALVEQSAAAAESLKMQADALSQSVRIFRLN
jgi:methyl-accepting chemotaxis protein